MVDGFDTPPQASRPRRTQWREQGDGVHAAEGSRVMQRCSGGSGAEVKAALLLPIVLCLSRMEAAAGPLFFEHGGGGPCAVW